MLKIIDNVDLKELEKFGFRQAGNGEYFFEKATSLECVFVGLDRHIYIETTLSEAHKAIVYDLLYKVYDLIQAGLVEKVKK